MATTIDAHDDHHGHDDHHDLGEFIAHHFDSAEQQFDSGKLGMWLFLIQEVLFFSGLFVAYTLFRYHNPQVFEDAHIFLDKTLGAVNTIVLLFSSLTMAWAVRCSQIEQKKGLVTCIVITMACAAIFLGVKAVEYSHKWEIGLWWRGLWESGQGPTGIADHDTPYLMYISAPFVLLCVGSFVMAIFHKVTDDDDNYAFYGLLGLSLLGYFVGVGLGLVLPTVKEAVGIKHIDSHKVIAEKYGVEYHAGGHADGDEHHDEKGKSHSDKDHSEKNHSEKNHSTSDKEPAKDSDKGHDDKPNKDAKKEEKSNALLPGSDEEFFVSLIDDKAKPDSEKSNSPESGPAEAAPPGGPESENATDKLSQNVGTFFSIYYIMTGLHAIHIIAGIIALAWLLRRSLLGHFRKDYFGPVDNVGLYWHLVDLIWIYLFPLMYLIH